MAKLVHLSGRREMVVVLDGEQAPTHYQIAQAAFASAHGAGQVVAGCVPDALDQGSQRRGSVVHVSPTLFEVGDDT